MPELAEVETLKCYLAQHVKGEEIAGLIAKRNNLRYSLNIGILQGRCAGQIVNVTRCAKFLVLELDNSYSIIFHLGMSGRLTVQDSDYVLQKHDHIVIQLKTGKQLVFNDARRFGMIYSCKTSELKKQYFLKNMGQEPLEDGFNAKYLLQKLVSRKAPIKTAIMDNKIVVGIGNIYAAESLFQAKINPLKPANELSQDEAGRLIISIKDTLHKAIKAGGTTLKDFVNGDNKPGYFKQELSVYDRAGKACYICKTLIEKIKQAGRSTYFCANCQK
jgi:formamidopyrimidine-DNA glycosylase